MDTPSEFDVDFERAMAELAAARDELLSKVRGLTDADLDVGRRGSWTVGAVLRHVVESDWYHGNGIASLRETDPPARESRQEEERPAPATVEEALALLDESGAALQATVEGVEEETFYRLRKVWSQEWSVLSYLEGSGDHYREHAEQIRNLLAQQR